ncbi:MAG: hypothetical protein HYZ53_21180 [Planctomycetes bacterium]|nr:hypothetical protein [Planctomycetota bacterium]
MNLREAWNDLRALFLRMNPAQRVSVAVSLLALGACLALLVLWGSADNLTPLLVDPPADVLGRAVKRLEEKGVPHQVKGGVLLVPVDQKERLVLDLAADGTFPEGVDPFKWVYEQDFTETGGKRDLKYQRSLVRRLEAVIGSLDAVQGVKVELVRTAEPSLVGDAQQAKVSVLLRLHPGRVLTKENILGIAKLVAGPVGATPENVALLDTAGKYYRVPNEKDLATTSSDQLELKTAFERQESAKLAAYLGFLEHKIVMVDVTLDFQSLKKQTHDIDPTRTVEVLEKEHTVREARPLAAGRTAGARGFGASGTPGVAGDVVSGPADGSGSTAEGAGPLGIATGPFNTLEPAAANGPSEQFGGAAPATLETESEIRREVSRSETTLEVPPGSIKEMSVAVVVDKDELVRRDVTVEALREQLAGACRVSDPSKLKLLAISFAAPPALPEATTLERYELLASRYASPALLGLVLLGATLLLLRTVRRTVPRDVVEEIARLRRQFEEEEAAGGPGAVPRRLAQVRRMVEESPRTAATLLGRWFEQTE